MDIEEIEERWKDKHWFPINPHKDIGWLISRVKELEASNKKLRKAIDAIYDPNCDCYLCVTFREALEE